MGAWDAGHRSAETVGREQRARQWADMWVREPDPRLARLAAVEAAVAYIRLGVRVGQVLDRFGVTVDELMARHQAVGPLDPVKEMLTPRMTVVPDP